MLLLFLFTNILPCALSRLVLHFYPLYMLIFTFLSSYAAILLNRFWRLSMLTFHHTFFQRHIWKKMIITHIMECSTQLQVNIKHLRVQVAALCCSCLVHSSEICQMVIYPRKSTLTCSEVHQDMRDLHSSQGSQLFG